MHVVVGGERLVGHNILSARDDARNVRSVRRSHGEHVGVVIRVIELIRHFCVFIQIARREIVFQSRRGQLAAFKRGGNFALRERLHRGHVLERRMRIVKPRIEHGDHHARTRVADARRIVNARVVSVYAVEHGVALRLVISFGKNDVFYAVGGGDRAQIGVGNRKRHAVHDARVLITQIVIDLIFIKTG